MNDASFYVGVAFFLLALLELVFAHRARRAAERAERRAELIATTAKIKLTTAVLAEQRALAMVRTVHELTPGARVLLEMRGGGGPGGLSS